MDAPEIRITGGMLRVDIGGRQLVLQPGEDIALFVKLGQVLASGTRHAPGPGARTLADAARCRALLDAAVAAGCSRETPPEVRRVVAAALRCEGCTLKEISALFGITRQRISQDLAAQNDAMTRLSSHGRARPAAIRLRRAAVTHAGLRGNA